MLGIFLHVALMAAVPQPVLEVPRGNAPVEVAMHPSVVTTFFAASGSTISVVARREEGIQVDISKDGRVVTATLRPSACRPGFLSNLIVYDGREVYTFPVLCASSPEEAVQVVRLGEPAAGRDLWEALVALGKKPGRDGCIDLGDGVRLCRQLPDKCQGAKAIGTYTLCKK